MTVRVAFRARLGALLLAGCLIGGQVLAQVSADPLEVIEAADTVCASAPEAFGCTTARARSAALMSLVIAEAGNTRDRGTFIDLVRAVLADPSPEIRTSAAYALAKLKPDATDTPAILRLLRDPVSNVRAGAWAAGWMSSDPAARLVARRVPLRPNRSGYVPDDPAQDFNHDALGFALPDGAAYLRLTQDRRNAFQLEFLTPDPQALVLGWAAGLGAGPTVPLTDLLASDPATASLALGFLDAAIFDDPQVLRLPPETNRPLRLVLVYRDVLFGQTGIAVVFGGTGTLFPAEPVVEVAPPGPVAPFDDAAVLGASGFKPDAQAEESDLFLSVLSAYGYGAERYLELYPDGAYAAEARDILAGPRLVLDAVSYTDTGTIIASFRNLPDGASASLVLLNVARDYATETSAHLSDASVDKASIDIAGRFAPGVYLMRAEVHPGDGGEVIVLRRDFSVTAGQAKLATDKAEFAPGEAITVRFSGMAGDDQDYISTASQDAPNGTYATYAYTGGLREGSVTLLAPTTPGPYELRAFFREDETTLRASLPFTVAGTAAPQATVAPTPGDPAPEARATLVLDKTSYAPGEVITVTFADMFGDGQDYVATAPAGSSNGIYLQYAYTKAAREGTATLLAPPTAGDYELRAFFREDEAILRASVAFTVE